MSCNFDPYTPVHSVMVQIERRWQAYGMESSVTFEEFCHLRENGKLTWFLGLKDPATRTATQYRHYIAFYVGIWNHLASAVACCREAKVVAEKSLRGLLLTALEHCQAADAIQAKLDQQIADAHAARVRGGKLRHAANDPARGEAARLLIGQRPNGGWPDPTTAARAILEDLKRFILDQRLSLVTGDYLVKTITGWIKRVPEVRAAFEGNQ